MADISKLSSENYLECLWRNPMQSIRVERSIAKDWLLHNKSVTVDGRVRWLQIKDIGLGICEVKLRPTGIGFGGTVVVKVFDSK